MFRVVVKLKKNLRTKARITTFSCCDGAANFPFEVGEEIFVKEGFWQFGGYDSGYDCDEPRFIGRNKITFSEEEANKTQTLGKVWKKRPAQYMKQEHSRLTLRIKSVKVERLQDIIPFDCVVEGIWDGRNVALGYSEAAKSYAVYWNSTHKKPEEKWEANPWVFAYEYEVVNAK